MGCNHERLAIWRGPRYRSPRCFPFSLGARRGYSLSEHQRGAGFSLQFFTSHEQIGKWGYAGDADLGADLTHPPCPRRDAGLTHGARSGSTALHDPSSSILFSLVRAWLISYCALGRAPPF